MLAEHITPPLLFSVVGSLVGSLFIVLWFFFQRLYKQNDKVNDRLDNIMVMVGDLKKHGHESEVRVNGRIDKLDGVVDGLRDQFNRDLSMAFTQIEKISGELKLLTYKVENEK